MVFHNNKLMERVNLRAGEWGFNLANSVEGATAELTMEQVSQVTFSVDDPDFQILRRSKLPLGADIGVMGERLSIAAIETGAGGGEGGFDIICRPRLVRKLKERKGAAVVSNISPSDYVRRETEAVGGRAHVQSSAKRGQIARDVKQKGDPESEENSAWTTFNRLANELGYVVYESSGTIHFGQPTWLMANNTRLNAYWTSNENRRGRRHLTDFPVIRESVDNFGILDGLIQATLQIPLEQAQYFRPGRGVSLHGMPRYSRTYLITSVSYPLAGGGTEVTVEAQTPKNPLPQKDIEP